MAEQGMDGWEGGVLAQLARLSAEYQGSGKACARTWREGAHVPGSYKVKVVAEPCTIQTIKVPNHNRVPTLAPLANQMFRVLRRLPHPRFESYCALFETVKLSSDSTWFPVLYAELHL